ncbi:MAG: helix-turn-helix domain-containing protein [Rhodobacteraceae bacterium]|nr:helix-turn-helix domain-containing protein [Paracoccaceae bacterium]
MADIVESFDETVAHQLMQLFGGQDVRFSDKPKPEMIRLMGEKKATEVCFFLSGQKLYVPHGRVGRRKAEVERLQAQNLTQDQIARALGISTRQVRNLSNAPVKPLPLFPDLPEKP